MKLAKLTIAFIIVLSLVVVNTSLFSQFKKVTFSSWKGIASYYHPKFNGRKTSTGEIFSNEKFTCANNFLKLGTYIRVTNSRNGKSVVVKVNDRMNAHNKRLIDLSQAAAKQLGLLNQGLGEVSIEITDASNEIVAVR